MQVVDAPTASELTAPVQFTELILSSLTLKFVRATLPLPACAGVGVPPLPQAVRTTASAPVPR